MTDPRIRYDIAANVEGEEQVRELEQRLDELGDTLDGDLAPRAKAAGAALRNALDARDALRGVTEMRTSVTEASRALVAAESALASYQRSMISAGPPTQRMVEQERLLAQAAQQARLVLEGKQATLRGAEGALAKYGATSANAQTAMRGLENAIQHAGSELRTLDPAWTQAGNAGEGAAGKVRRAWQGLGQRIASDFNSSIKNIAAGNIVANVVGSVANAISQMGKRALDANLQLEGLRKAFTAVYKDAGLAESQIAFLRKTSDAAGVSFSALADDFKSFAASTQAANIPINVTNELFASVVKSGSALGLTGERVGLVLQSLSQMAGKGVVSMEELRQQLGESLPGAMSLAAKGLGITDQQLIKLVESGQLAARDLFPALAKSLKDLSGEATGVGSTMERVKNAFDSTFRNLGDAGGMTVLNAALKALAVAAGLVVVPLQAIGEVLANVAQGAGALAASFAVLTDGSTTLAQKWAGLKEVGAAFGEDIAKSDARLRDTTAAFAQAAGASDQTATAIRGAGQAASTAAGQMQQATGAAAVQGQRVSDLGAQWVALSTKLGETSAQQAKQITLSEKQAAAAKIEGESMVALTQLRGNELETMRAEALAADANAVALQKVAQARADQLVTLQAEFAQKQLMLAGDPDEAKRRQQEMDDLAKKIELQKAAADASSAEASQAANTAAQREISVKSYGETAGALAGLKRAMDQAVLAEQAVSSMADRGTASQQRAQEAKRRAAVATALYNDALADEIRLSSAQVQVQQATNDLLQAGFQHQKTEIALAIEKARRDGDEYKVRQLLIQQKEIDIQIAAARIQTMRAEAEAAIASAKAELANLEATGQITSAKRMEIDARIKAAEAKQMEASTNQLIVDALKKEVQEIRTGVRDIGALGDAYSDYGNRARAAVDHVTGGLREQVGVIGQAQQGMRTLEELTSRPGGRTAEDMYSRPEGGSVTGANSPTRKGYSMQYESELHAKLAAAENNALWVSEAAKQGLADLKAMSQARQQLAEVKKELRQAGIDLKYDVRTGKFTDYSRDAGAPSSNRTQTIKLQLNGASQGEVNTDDAGAETIQSVLSQIQRAGRTAAKRR